MGNGTLGCGGWISARTTCARALRSTVPSTPHRASRPSVRLGRHPAPEHQRVNAVFRTQPWRDFTSLEDYKIKWHTRLAFGVGELIVTGVAEVAQLGAGDRRAGLDGPGREV